MTEPNPPTSKPTESGEPGFAAQAEEKAPGLIQEFIDFVWHYKLWWMVPILVVLLLVGVLIVLSASGAAPFIYPLF